MRVVIAIVVLVFVMLAVFTAANWNVLNISTPLSFVAFSVEGPLGVILLGVSLVLTLLVVSYALLLRTSWLMESRRLNRQLDVQRDLAEKAEASRFVALQELVEREFREVRSSLETQSAFALASIESAEQSLARTINENTNSLVAHIGYLDDRMKGGSPSPDA